MARAEPVPAAPARAAFRGDPGGVSLCAPPEAEEDVGCGDGDATSPGWIPSMQYGSLKPATARAVRRHTSHCFRRIELVPRIQSSGKLGRVALVRTNVSEKRSASIIRVTRVGEIATTLAVSSNLSTLRKILNYMTKHPKRLHSFIVIDVKTSNLTQH
jgi:hypothetical protein